jgi:hypothetical protein
MMLDIPGVVPGRRPKMTTMTFKNKTFVTIETECSFTKPHDIALTAVVRAIEAVREGRKVGQNVTGCFMLAQVYCAVFATPSGQMRYQVGPMGKPTRNDTHMMATLVTAIRNQQELAEKNSRRVPMVADVNYCEGHEVHVTLKGQRLLAIDSGRGYPKYFHVGAIPRGQSGRQVTGGPLVPGPWAFASGRATCLTANRAIAERDAVEEANALHVSDGSKVWIDGVEYTVRIVRGEFIELGVSC